MHIIAYMIKEINKFKALGEETRFRIVRLLIKSGMELCVCEIERIINKPQYNISKSLKILKNTGLIDERRDGKFVMYKIANNISNLQLFNYISSSEFSNDEFSNANDDVSNENNNDQLNSDLINLNLILNLRVEGRIIVDRLQRDTKACLRCK